MIISSLRHPIVKRIRSLGDRKERDETGLFFADGIRISLAAARAGVVETLLVAPSRLDDGTRSLLERDNNFLDLPRLDLTDEVFRSATRRDNPKGLAVIARQTWLRLNAEQPTADRYWLALDGISDPGNLGTIIRTCAATGIDGLVLLGESTDPYNRLALRASAETIFRLRLMRASFDELLNWTRLNNVRLVGTTPRAADEYPDVAYTPPMILLMGNESLGLSDPQQAACDQLVKIPMAGELDSLNVSVATGVLLYEIFQQRRNC